MIQRKTSWSKGIRFVGLLALVTLVAFSGCKQPSSDTVSLSGNADLSALTVSPGVLSPEFSPSVMEYTVTLAYTQSAIKVEGTPSDSKATVGGDAGKSVTLVHGENSVSIVVTAEDGTKKTYHLAVTRTNPAERHITFNKNADDATGTMSDQSLLQGASAALTANAFVRTGYLFTGWATSSTGSVTYADKASYTIGDDNAELYAVWSVNSESNADLSTLTVSTGTLNPSFSPTTLAYTVTLAYTQAAITVSGTPSDTRATVGGDAGTSVSLTYGANTIELLVTSANGTEKTYTVTVTRTNPLQRHISFNKNANDATGSMDDLPLLQGASVTLSGNIFTRTGYTFSGWATSSTGLFAYADKDPYTIGDDNAELFALWTRIPSSNANLSAITLDRGVLNTAFSPSVQSYTVALAYNQTSITVTGTRSDPNATVGGDSGTTVALSYGDKTISILVTAENGAVKTYTVVVTRASPLNLHVTFNKNANDAAGSMDDKAILQGATGTLTANIFMRKGFEFAGWATSSTGSVAYDDTDSYVMGDENAELYAVWNPVGSIAAVVTLSGSGDVTFTGTVTVAKGSTLTVTVTNADLTNFKWYLDGVEVSGQTTGVFAMDTTNLSAGVHTLMVVAKDSANVQYSSSLTVKITN